MVKMKALQVLIFGTHNFDPPPLPGSNPANRQLNMLEKLLLLDTSKEGLPDGIGTRIYLFGARLEKEIQILDNARLKIFEKFGGVHTGNRVVLPEDKIELVRKMCTDHRLNLPDAEKKMQREYPEVYEEYRKQQDNVDACNEAHRKFLDSEVEINVPVLPRVLINQNLQWVDLQARDPDKKFVPVMPMEMGLLMPFVESDPAEENPASVSGKATPIRAKKRA